VVDGDTLALGRERVRLIGVDTPETVAPDRGVECFGPQASARVEALVEGARVRLEFDAERRDRYGRLLAYVRRSGDGLFLNEVLVRDGYARPLVVAPNDRYAARFGRLARRARSAGRGLWSPEGCAGRR
jgi:micrococcal nuclease